MLTLFLHYDLGVTGSKAFYLGDITCISLLWEPILESSIPSHGNNQIIKILTCVNLVLNLLIPGQFSPYHYFLDEN